jgi:hypothetical protein
MTLSLNKEKETFNRVGRLNGGRWRVQNPADCSCAAKVFLSGRAFSLVWSGISRTWRAKPVARCRESRSLTCSTRAGCGARAGEEGIARWVRAG